jgi:hypothetical protein
VGPVLGDYVLRRGSPSVHVHLHPHICEQLNL